jgi:hypothetical protein
LRWWFAQPLGLSVAMVLVTPFFNSKYALSFTLPYPTAFFRVELCCLAMPGADLLIGLLQMCNFVDVRIDKLS